MTTTTDREKEARDFGESLCAKAFATCKESGTAPLICLVIVDIDAPKDEIDMTYLSREAKRSPTGGFLLRRGWEVIWGNACADTSRVGTHLDLYRSLGQIHNYSNSDKQYYLTGFSETTENWAALKLLCGVTWGKRAQKSELTEAREEISRVCAEASRCKTQPVFGYDLRMRAQMPDLPPEEAHDAPHT